MRRLLLCIFTLLLAGAAHAGHIKGGFFSYEYLGPGSGINLRYKVTLNVYMICNPSTGQLSQTINISIFDKGTGALFANPSVGIRNQFQLGKKFDEPCISGNQIECYYLIVQYVIDEIELPRSLNGYTLAYQRCCRLPGINNIENSSSIGNTYSVDIPGTALGTTAPLNSSPQFQINDTVLVCRNSSFTYPFATTDPDGDALSYSFCNAYVGASQGDPSPGTSSPPPFTSVNYTGGYSGGAPLGNSVTINPSTGLVSGFAPDVDGEYVVTICVTETRNGEVISVNRKELHMQVKDCSPVQAILDPVYPTCDGFTRTFTNNAPPNPEVRSHFWDFGDGNTSTEESPTHTYADTGVYRIKLVLNRNDFCADSSTALVKVFPGFFPGFTTQGICAGKPTRFFDTTRTVYGVVDTWRWDFGNTAATNDTSRQQNPTYTYPTIGVKTVQFIVTNSKGCIDTVLKDIEILDRPLLTLPFKDTLICKGDAVQLLAEGTGNFTWTPNIEITGATTPNPIATPSVTRHYKIQLDYEGCLATDSVRVRVLDFIGATARPDTTICYPDSVLLYGSTTGLRYEWTPAAGIQNPAALRTQALPLMPGVNTYRLTTYLGGCTPASDEVQVLAVPYPVVTAVADDDTICFNSATTLRGTTDGDRILWRPAGTLTGANTLTPLAKPLATTTYILTVTSSTSGCPKPVSDTVVVTVLPKIFPFAGRDTAVIAGQPLQFNGSGGVRYVWSPGTDLSATDIPNPVGTYKGNYDAIRYKLDVFNEAGCSDSAFVTVKIFRTVPSVFVPTAFSPNGDGRNDIIRPIAVGIARIKYFRIFNRWGQLVYSTTVNGLGWNGQINGQPQANNVYVWIVGAVDYLGKEIEAKGTVTLVR